MIQDEPNHYEDVNPYYYCSVAGIAHKLATDYGLAVPDWVHKPEYVLDEPYFQGNTNKKVLQDYYKNVSPHEFRIRNIFIDTNALNRV